MAALLRLIVVAAALFAIAAAGPAGCNIVAPAYFLLHGPPKTPAAYELEDRPTIVFVDDRNNAIPRNSATLRRSIADHTSEDLMTREILTTTIRPQDAISLARQSDRFDEVMSIEELGRAVGAEQVIYVQMLAFTETVDGATPRPAAACEVKVIDVVNRYRLFPPDGGDESGFMVQVTMGTLNTEAYQSASSRLQIHQALAIKTGDEVAKLFYDHETTELGGNLTPR
jgi:hypothetical protein